MLKAKRLKSMFVLYSACAVMATGFTSQAASEQPEVTTITETKGENTNTHTAVQAISQNIVASAQEGQVAVGAVIMNRVKSGSYPNSIEEVIYQSGQFGPAATGWLNRVRSSKGYSQTALQAAVDALNGSNPIGNCLYFDQGGAGMKIGAHYFH